MSILVFVPRESVFPQFAHELTLDFEIDIASDFGFNHARVPGFLVTMLSIVPCDKCGDQLVPTPGGILQRLEAFVASPIGCGGSDVRIA
ncbi:hypothetical protein Tco_1494363 [Tanacetum coccineum]